MKKTIVTALSAIALLLCSSCSGNKGGKLAGAGATFPEPFYKVVFKKYGATTGHDVTYGAIGSGGGIRSLKDKTVDFGASDVFLSDEEMKKMPAEVVHVPTCMGAVVLSYNLPGIKDLRLTPELISGIYLGHITKWNDDKIKAVNPDLNLPDQAITPVYRSDGSGSTAVFSDYMSKVDNEWRTTIGHGKSLNFPNGVSAKGNAGVSGIISETAGSIGYIGSEYSSVLQLPAAALLNKAGNYITATAETISKAADTTIPDDTRTMITNSDNPEAYPISTFTWILVYKDQKYNGRSEKQAKDLVDLLSYVLSDEGQTLATKTGYAPLSQTALSKARQALTTVTYGGKVVKEAAQK